MTHVSLVSIQHPLIKEAWDTFYLCATPLLLAIILARANAYSLALTTLCLNGCVYYWKLYFIDIETAFFTKTPVNPNNISMIFVIAHYLEQIQIAILGT